MSSETSISMNPSHFSEYQNARMEKSEPRKQVCYGRVNDLESKIKQNWWKDIFADNMYLKTDGDVVEDPEITTDEIKLLEADDDILNIFLRGSKQSEDEFLRTAEPAKILDLCCGQGRHALHLAGKYPHLSINGHDQSSFLIQLAIERSEQSNLTSNTCFTVGDCREIPYPNSSFDLVLVMGNSFGYFSDDQADKLVLSEIFRVLSPGGNLIIDLTDGGYMRENFNERSWEWVDDNTFVCRERALTKDGLRLNSREVISDTNIGVVRDQFYQERLYSKNELISILESSGYSVEGMKNNVVVENVPSNVYEDDESFTSDMKDMPVALFTAAKELSKRGEDLGMMEQRIVIKAVKPALPNLLNVEQERKFSKNLSLDSTSNPSTETFDSDQNTVDSSTQGPNGIVINSFKDFQKLKWKLNMELLYKKLCLVDPDLNWEPKYNLPFKVLTVILGDPNQKCLGKFDNNWNTEDFETRKKLMDCLYDLGFKQKNVVVIDKHSEILNTLLSKKPDFVFNLCDEGLNNDALKELHIPAILDMLEVPYSGAGPTCLSVCFDKGLVNRSAQMIGVPIPRELYFSLDDETELDINDLDKQIKECVLYPAFIKPLKGDNSLGITEHSLVHNIEDLKKYFVKLNPSWGLSDFIIQEYLKGTEFSVGMIGNPDIVLEVDYSKIINLKLTPILGFESKWDPSSPYWSEVKFKKAKLNPKTLKKLKSNCIALFKRFQLKDYGRFDFRCSNLTLSRCEQENQDYSSSIKLLEVNPNPGWCWDGKLAHMAMNEGFDYKDVIMMILWAAYSRIKK
ncbi:hypothetical protein HDU92_002841 [Lobulomyces angularis]|nr:hypothetical protein HDU92_002841 [Lobulomyces angularis]